MTEGDSVFIDTNVLVYAGVREAPKHEEAHRLLSCLNDGGWKIWISRQILREYLVTLTRPQAFTPPIAVDKVVAQVAELERRFAVAEETPEVTRCLLDLVEKTGVGGKRIHDANIVATMLAGGIANLATYNEKDFGCFSGHISLLSIDGLLEGPKGQPKGQTVE